MKLKPQNLEAEGGWLLDWIEMVFRTKKVGSRPHYLVINADDQNLELVKIETYLDSSLKN